MILKSGKHLSGYVTLLSVLILGAVAVLISTSVILLGLGSSRTSLSLTNSAQAKALANACAEEALQQIHDNKYYEGTGNLSLGDGDCEYSVISLGVQNREINSTGNVSNVTRKVKITIDQITSEINVSSWQEVSGF